MKSKDPPLKNLDPDCEQHRVALKKENAKLQAKIVTLEVANLSLRNKVTALEKELVKRPSFAEALSRLPGMDKVHKRESSK